MLLDHAARPDAGPSRADSAAVRASRRGTRWAAGAALAAGALLAACGGGARDAERASGAAAIGEDDARVASVASEPAGPAGLEGEPAAASAPVTPELQVVSHEANATVTEQRVQFRGVATAGSVVIADATVAESGRYGHWAITLELEPGPNLMTFTMIDAVGATSKESILVHYAPTPVAPTAASASSAAKADPPPQHDRNPTSKDAGAGLSAGAFSAHQKYGSCGEDPPYDVFSGTAAAGAAISISSPYGSGSAVADEHGSWLVTVYFPTAPSGQTFEVTASDGSNARTFSFVHSL